MLIWMAKLVRQFFYMLDNIIYNGIIEIYQLLIAISRTSVLSQASIQSIGNRIYQLLAVFMAFKIIFSLIMYVVNPDDFSDKSKGVSKLGMNVIITLSLLVLTPYIFSYAFNLQNIILEDNSLGALIFGDNDDDSPEDSSIFVRAGESIAFNTMKPFFVPNSSVSEFSECVVLENDNNNFNESCSGIDFESDDILNGEENTMAGVITKSGNEVNYTKFDVANYVYGFENGSLSLMFRPEMVLATTKTTGTNDQKIVTFVMDYKFFFSTPIGVIVLLLLITYCMDVALRSVKLSFLQLVAPIPILSYLDPKSGKDGMFKKWYQMCFKTYISLFVRLLALYFAIFIISKIDKMSDVLDGSYQTNTWVKIFVIVGALMFAKQLPKILEGLGIKLDGDGKFTLNPFKKLENEAIGGKRLTGMMGGMTAGLADRAARIATAPKGKKLSALASSPLGVLGGAARGFGSNGGFKGGLDKQAEINRRLRESRIKGLSPASAYLDYAGSKFGLDDATLESEATRIQRNEDNKAKAEKIISDRTRQNELNIKSANEQMKPLKSVENRRNSVKTAGENLKKQAEDFAGKKADFKRKDEDTMRLEAIDKIKKGRYADLSVEQANYLRGNGVSIIPTGSKADIDSREATIAQLERLANSNQYTTNRRADSANVQFLKDNQGKKLEKAIVVGEGKDQVVLQAGTYVDGNVVAQAEAAQGRYIKSSQEAVYNELAKGENSEYADTAKDDYDAFQRGYGVYEEAVNTANEEVDKYNEDNPYDLEIKKLSADARDFKNLDGTIHEVENGEDTINITKNINETTYQIEAWEKENSDTRSKVMVVYYDKNGETREMTLDEYNSLSKTEKEELEKRKKQHMEAKSLWQKIGNK